jgi:chemotaxis protein methyltransferase CheR
MDSTVFQELRKMAYEQAGIALRENKEALLSARIAKRMRKLGLHAEQEYLEYLRNDGSGSEMVEFLDAISTNFTSFFREQDHFELLQREATTWLEEQRSAVRIWCAAAATGEEPYSLAMTLNETLAGRDVDWRILATDISVGALLTAQAGRYEDARLTPVPAALRRKYFLPDTAESGRGNRVSETLREHITFTRLNLATPPFPMRGGLDAVFCRNVMLYFDNTVRQKLIAEIELLLRPGGLLVIAHSETLNGVRSGLKTVRPSVYRKAVL